ncbi:hypothetical protein HQ560_01745, partial [bacterium]|nr:hypothetical protein [bacterium]
MRGHDGQEDRRATVAFAFAAAALIVLGAPARGAGDSAPASRPPHSIAVLDFVDRTPRAGRGWLAKGLADMVITDLSASRRLLVVDRERMQHVVREMALGATGHVDRATAPRAGQIAKVRWVLFGSFAHTGGRVALEALLIDVEEQRTLRIEQVRGPVAKIFALEQALVAAVVRKLDAPMTEAELRLTKLLKTESLPAFEHHARSLGLFDDGRWFDAFVEERLARKADARYVAAHIRVARLYDELGALEHARVEYRALADGDSRNALPAAFYFRMGVLLGDTMGDRAPAAVALQRILVRQPKLALPFRITDPPERSYEWQYTQLGAWEAKITNISPTFLHLKALDRLAVWALDAGRPFEAAGFYSRIARIVSTRKSAIGATSLVRPFLEEAMKRYEALYWRFVLEDRDATLYPPAAVHLLSAKDATARPGAKPTHSGGHGINWLAPPGHVIAQVRFVLRPAAPAAKPQQGRRKPRSPYSVRLMCPGYHDLLLDHVEG